MKLYESGISLQRQAMEEQNLELIMYLLNVHGLDLRCLRTLTEPSALLDCSGVHTGKGDSSWYFGFDLNVSDMEQIDH